MHSICYGYLEESRIRGKGGDGNGIDQERVWGRSRAKCCIGVVFGGDMLLGSLCQLLKVWDVVVSGIALGSCQGNGAVVMVAVTMAASRESFIREADWLGGPEVFGGAWGHSGFFAGTQGGRSVCTGPASRLGAGRGREQLE